MLTIKRFRQWRRCCLPKDPDAAFHSQSTNAVEERLASLLDACYSISALLQIHAQIVTNGLSQQPNYAARRLVAFCTSSPYGDVGHARAFFDRVVHPSVFMWNSMIRGVCNGGSVDAKDAISLYKRMHSEDEAKPNSFTFNFVSKACAVAVAIDEGKEVHAQIVKAGFRGSSHVIVTMVSMYARCGKVSDAHRLFDEMAERNLVAWSAMISGYARAGMATRALGLFREMQFAGMEPDEVTLVSVVSACAQVGALDTGRWIHAYAEKQRIELDVVLGTALVDMYAKCGCIERARRLFDEMPHKDAMAWSSMVMGLAAHGLAEEALDVFSSMRVASVKPNGVTFIGVLSACVHGGLVDQGKYYFDMMTEHGISPQMEHYGCMVDLLCRAGLFDEAHKCLRGMPMEPNAVMWRTLLVACKNKGDLAKGEAVAERLLELEPGNAENYVLLSNLYAAQSRWEDVSSVRRTMKLSGVKPIPACSSIEVDGVVHEFFMGDESHPESEELYAFLKDVMLMVHRAGYEFKTSAVLHDFGEEEKVNSLAQHCEKLAVAFGLMKTRAPAVIRIVKNLRICCDCHEFMKIISKIFDRVIIVRDRVRFHCFIDGLCSCKEYW